MKKLLIATVGAAFLASSAYAVTQGNVGQTSSGQIDINLEILEELLVSNLTPIDLSPADGSGGTVYQPGIDMSGTSEICAYYNNQATLDIVFDSNSTPGAFTLDAGGNSIPYNVALDTDGNGSFDVLGVVEAADNNIASFTTNQNCDAGTNNNAGVEITIASGDIDAAITAGTANGTYTELLDVTVHP